MSLDCLKKTLALCLCAVTVLAAPIAGFAGEDKTVLSATTEIDGEMGVSREEAVSIAKKAAEDAKIDLKDVYEVNATPLSLFSEEEWFVAFHVKDAFPPYAGVRMRKKDGKILDVSKDNITQYKKKWEKIKGIEALWSPEDHVLFEEAYYPKGFGLSCLPEADDLPWETILAIAREEVKSRKKLSDEKMLSYQVGGYMTHGAPQKDGGKAWIVMFVPMDKTGKQRVKYQVNVNAKTGEVLFFGPDENGTLG